MLGKQFRRDQFILVNAMGDCRIRLAREDKVQRNPVGARSLEGLGVLGRLDLEGLLLFMYPNFILWWIIDHLEGGGEVFRQVLRFPLR